MILPNKAVNVKDSLLYKSIKYYNDNEFFDLKKSEEIIFLTILFAIEYIEYKEENGNIKIYKIK